MADVQITCINKQPRDDPHEGITHLGNPAANWKWPRQQVINSINAKENTFYTSVNGKRADVGVVNGPTDNTYALMPMASGTTISWHLPNVPSQTWSSRGAIGMRYGFYLFIDEAGDEGLERIRPIAPDGSSEYFVMCGVLVRTTKYAELAQSFNSIKLKVGIAPTDQIHFRDLNQAQKSTVISSLANLKFGLVAIVSNKRNMLRYRNLRCEAKNFEVARGRIRPLRYNWFYNGLFRYLLERASAECKKWTYPAFGEVRPIQVIFSRRKELSYSQTKAYLFKLKTERHSRSYFNNKGQIDWSVVDIFDIDSRKHKDEIGLQIADCAASAIFRSLDESWFGNVTPQYLQLLRNRFIRLNATPWDYGFKLLPDNFRGPLSDEQRQGLTSVGYKP